MAQLKRTPLYESYIQQGVKTVDFGGWELPVQFSSMKEEHKAVRTKAGLFDVSHMGEVEVSGKNALPFLQRLMTNDVSKIRDGQAQYTAMCNERGGTIDDLLIYRQASDHFFLVLNAANTVKDINWMKEHLIADVTVTDVSNEIALLAIQGPSAQDIVQRLTDLDLTSLRFFRFADGVNVAGVRVLISRTGYTGEDGFELYCKSRDVQVLWKALLEEGQEDGLLPCGLGVRDLLRFEAGLPLYGQELTEEISPLEAGIGFAVKLDKKEDFIGKASLAKQKEEGVTRKIVGLEMIDKGIPRTDYPVFSMEKQVGIMTSGTHSLTLKKNVGFALLEHEYSELGTVVDVQIRKKRLKAKVVATPFYRR